MGNSSHHEIPQTFFETSHPALRECKIEKTSNLLEMHVSPGPTYSNWKWNLSPLESYSKHLFQPAKFLEGDSNLNKEKSGWCDAQDHEGSWDRISVFYEGFIYGLEGEILIRRARNLRFREHELWKVLKIGILAIKDWNYVYPDLSIDLITPRNILFNSEGKIKIAHRFSFLEESLEGQNPAYIPLSTVPKKQQESPLSVSIYSLGVSLLDATSLCQSRYSSMGLEEKKVLLHKSNLYPFEIKDTIRRMVEYDPINRIDLNEILLAVQKYKEICKSSSHDFY